MSTEIKGSSIDSLAGILDVNRTANGKIKQWSTNLDKRQGLTYQDIFNASDRLSSYFQGHNVKPGDRIMLWGSNSPQWVISYFATLTAGAIVVPFDVGREADFFNKVIEATSPRFIIAGDTQKAAIPGNNNVPILDLEKIDRVPEMVNKKSEIRASRADVAEVVFTSGTTGNPKGVVLTHGNILSNVEAISSVVRIKPYYKLLSILPLSHMFETTAGLLTPMISGASVAYMDSLLPASILAAMQEEKITCMAVVPQALQSFKRGIEQQVKKTGKEKQFNFMQGLSPKLPELLRKVAFKALHERMGGKFEFFVSGGARLDLKLADFWENLGIKILQGYGMTEASPVVTCDSMFDRNHQFVGRILPGVEVKIAEDGEILVKGPNVMREYWENPAASEQVLENGWYRTGDLGLLDKGRLKLMGRKGSMIVLPDGMNLYPEDIEQVLVAQDESLIREAVVFYEEYETDKGSKGRLHAVLLLSDSTINPRDLVKEANNKLPSYQSVDRFSVWQEEDFPRTHTLKAKRNEIIKRIKEQK